MFGYGPGAFDDETGMTADELHARFPDWHLTSTVRGTNSVPTWWFSLDRRADG
jgi:hypothetical protein